MLKAYNKRLNKDGFNFNSTVSVRILYVLYTYMDISTNKETGKVNFPASALTHPLAKQK